VSGVLRRLAARALGVAPTVRPVVGWAAETGVRATADTPALVPETSLEDGGPLPQAAARTAERTPTGAGPLAPEPPQVMVAPGAPLRSEQRVTRPLAAATPTAPREALRAPARSATPPEAHVELGDPRRAPGDRTAASHDAIRDAPPLLPLQRVARLLPPQALAASTPSRAAAARPPIEETTEVHVSIGRIEVTAVQEAPPPRREPARPRKPKSLEAYLATRQGSRP
jgi:hypothetical protein